MSKITLNSIASLDAINAAATVNANMVTIQNAFDNNLSRDGTSPNQMSSNLDMNSFRLLNLPVPASGTDPLRVQDLGSYVVTTANQITVPNSTVQNSIVTWNSTNGLTLGNASAATLATSITVPLHIGGSGTTGTQLTLQTTSGNGTTDTLAIKGGNNGATTFASISNTGISLSSATQQFAVNAVGAGNGFLLTNAVAGIYAALSSGNNGHYTIFQAPSGAAFFQARDADNGGADANWGYMNNDTLQITNRANNTNFVRINSTGLKVQVGGVFLGASSFKPGADNTAQIYTDAARGLVFYGQTGSTYDFGFFSAAGTNLFMNPTGTANVNIITNDSNGVQGKLGIGANAVSTTIVQLGIGTTAFSQMNWGTTSVAPTTPVNGDMWFDGTNFKCRIGGATKTFTVA